MSVANRKNVRDALAALLTTRLTSAQRVYPLTTDGGDRITQPPEFGGESPVVVVVSAGSGRDGAGKRTFGGPIAPTFYLDVYLFVLSEVKDADGNSIVNPGVDDQLDTLEADVAQVVADYPKTEAWTALSYDGRSNTDMVTILDGSQYKREIIPLALTGK